MDYASAKSRRRFSLFAWCVLAYNLPVILWGAYVRASFSGDGCGANWPTCNGQFIPYTMATPMAIELTHRLSTSLDTFGVLALVIWAFLAFRKRSAVRRYAVYSLVFLLIEALLGAGLVLFRLVAKDQSAGRVWYLSAHLTNTILLLAALTISAWLAYTETEQLRLRDAPKPVLWGLAVAVFVSITGTITALGDTLYPAASLSAGMQQDFASASGMLLRLRVVHPVIAFAGAVYLVWIASAILRKSGAESRASKELAQNGAQQAPQKPASPSSGCGAACALCASKAAMLVISITIVQLAVGLLNLALLAPLAMQLMHLLIADLVWISLVLLALETARTANAVAPRLVHA